MSDGLHAVRSHRSGAAVDFKVWEWLIALLVTGLIVFVMPIPRMATLLVVFAAAIVKAVLVLRKYMHLQAENWLLYLIAATPVLLILGMAIALLPDIAFKQ